MLEEFLGNSGLEYEWWHCGIRARTLGGKGLLRPQLPIFFFLCQKWCAIWSEGCVATWANLGFWGLFLVSYTLNVKQHHVKTDWVMLIMKHGLNVTGPLLFIISLFFLNDILKSLCSPGYLYFFGMSSLRTGVSWRSEICFCYVEPTQGPQHRLWKSCLWLGRTPVLTLKQMWYQHKDQQCARRELKYQPYGQSLLEFRMFAMGFRQVALLLLLDQTLAIFLCCPQPPSSSIFLCEDINCCPQITRQQMFTIQPPDTLLGFQEDYLDTRSRTWFLKPMRCDHACNLWLGP